MEIHEALKILSDVLGFDCSSFKEVVENSAMQQFYFSLEEAIDINKKLNALAGLLGYEDTFKVYKRKLYDVGLVYTSFNDHDSAREMFELVELPDLRNFQKRSWTKT